MNLLGYELRRSHTKRVRTSHLLILTHIQAPLQEEGRLNTAGKDVLIGAITFFAGNAKPGSSPLTAGSAIFTAT